LSVLSWLIIDNIILKAKMEKKSCFVLPIKIGFLETKKISIKFDISSKIAP